MKRMRRAATSAAMLVGIAGTALAAPPASAASFSTGNEDIGTMASYSCDTGVTNRYAWAYCTVYSGQVRLRGDCVAAPDVYSKWIGVGTYYIETNSCAFSIRSQPIIEARG